MAGDPGFEPGLTDPESAVLPLDESPTSSAIITEAYRRGNLVFVVIFFSYFLWFFTLSSFLLLNS